MELITILGVAASVASIIEVSTTCIKSLLDIRAQYQITDLNVQISIAQLSTLKAALLQISAWKCGSSDFIPANLETDLDLSLNGCKALVDGLSDRLKPFTLGQAPLLNFRKKAHFLLNAKDRTQVEQEALLRRPESVKILSSFRDDSSSLLWLRDDDSSGTQRSMFTERSDLLDNSFAFDTEIFKSRPYLTVMRSHLKQAVKVSARKVRYGTIDGKMASRSVDEKMKPVTGGKGRQLTPSSETFCDPSSCNSTPSTTAISESTMDSQSVVSQEYSISLSAKAHRGSSQRPGFWKARSASLTHSQNSTNIIDLYGVESASAETSILLTGTAKQMALNLQRSIKFAYGRNYTTAKLEAFRISIMRKLIHNMRILLFSIKDLGLSLDPSNDFHAHVISTVSETDVFDHLPADVYTALTVLWKDPAVCNAYRNGRVQWYWDDPDFFDSLERISQNGYRPSLEDVSKASCTTQEIQDVIVTKKSAGNCHDYRFIDAVDAEAERSQWIYSSSVISLVIYIADAATHDESFDGTQSPSCLEQDLVLLRQICSSRWLSSTPLLVLLVNTGETEGKWYRSDKPRYSNHSGDRSRIGLSRSRIRDMFLHVERKYDMRLHVEYLESGVTASIGKTAIGMIDKILTEQSVLNYGID
ncbi:MAG: hypothetical protein Q9219_003489 [cf. Caloplaca sp. 3 TL-2023]